MNLPARLGVLGWLIWVSACQRPDPVAPMPAQSSDAALLRIALEHDGTAYSTTISGNTVTLDRPLPFTAQAVTVQQLELAPQATASQRIGDELPVSDVPVAITVTAEDRRAQRTYALQLDREAAPDFDSLLFAQYSARNCGAYATLTLGDLKLENNVWNAGGLPSNSYSQCIYTYDQGARPLLGWAWQYPDNAPGVNAYPQLIYGFKPWQPPSTSPDLPRKVSDIQRLKVTYAAEVTRNGGDYNLAFDNWINASADITPQNILFEFMIWEDTHRLVPFGDYQGEVVTSHGTYRFYMGEPDWEPPGSNWTYLAFQRIGNRTQGTVDIDELLSYLINQNIVPTDSYLASLELGNEVGNSTGRTVISRFAVDLE
ncbi:MAG: hypothetical protein AAGN35_03260 [Bacteroidota bacterium]